MERYLDEGSARLIEWMQRPREAWLRDLAEVGLMTINEVRAATLRPFYRTFHPVVRSEDLAEQSTGDRAQRRAVPMYLHYVEVVE